MSTYEKLHLANNLDALYLIALKSKIGKSLKFGQYCNLLTTLFKEAEKFALDQELRYVYITRYMLLYQDMLNTQTDKEFIQIRFGKEYEKVSAWLEETKQSLSKRYSFEINAANNASAAIKQPSQAIEPVEKTRTFTTNFITSQQLISALEMSKKNILLVDARPAKDFNESHANAPNIINIPDEVITSGLSANILTKRLSEEMQKIWENRDKFDVIVLLDWNTTAESLKLTKLDSLRSAIVDWDPNRHYNELPVILSGGYLDLLQTYPTKCQNPLVLLNRRNNELDELLDLDNVQYPTESDSKIHVMATSPPENNNLPETTIMEDMPNENLIQVNNDLNVNRDEIVKKLINEEEEFKRLNELCDNENDVNKLAEMKDREKEVREEIDNLEETLLELTKRKQVVKKAIEDKSIDMTNVEKNEADEKRQILDAIADEKVKALEQARKLKPKSFAPVVNRATKPSNMQTVYFPPIPLVTYTTNALKNIRNTCYMNTIVQILANLPPIVGLFCRGMINRERIRRPSAIIMETANLVRELWTPKSHFIIPTEFYDKVCKLESSYGSGQHEDCMEFFLFLLNYLSEDCAYELQRPDIMTPKQIAWYNQFQGKNSIFIDLFYHQIRVKQQCSNCFKKTYKFEIESTFMLSVPETDFTLESLMDEYMAEYVINDYCCSKCKRPVTNYKEISYEPKIVVIILKRYRQFVTNGELSIEKVSSKCSFPKTNFRLGNQSYNLHGIAMHSGNMNFGHYSAAGLTQKGWYELNDEFVRPMNIDDLNVRSRACAFFYCRRDK